MADQSLYERLGGVFAIAAVVDHFSDAVVEPGCLLLRIVGATDRDTDAERWRGLHLQDREHPHDRRQLDGGPHRRRVAVQRVLADRQLGGALPEYRLRREHARAHQHHPPDRGPRVGSGAGAQRRRDDGHQHHHQRLDLRGCADSHANRDAGGYANRHASGYANRHASGYANRDAGGYANGYADRHPSGYANRDSERCPAPDGYGRGTWAGRRFNLAPRADRFVPRRRRCERQIPSGSRPLAPGEVNDVAHPLRTTVDAVWPEGSRSSRPMAGHCAAPLRRWWCAPSE